MADRGNYTTKDLKNLKEEMKEDLRENLKNFKEEMIHQFHIISEDLRTQIKQVAEGVANIYEKSEGDKVELKKEIQETRHEVLAAIKFSYADLDRRLTTLENEFLALKRRIEKIEGRSVS